MVSSTQKSDKKSLTKLFGVCPFLYGTNKVEYDKCPCGKYAKYVNIIWRVFNNMSIFNKG